ncbi:hypothetical protein KOEU_16620 [Komagataeibacter europaeus]|uniref:Uncharacterized protein n=1 Tax=Komagataeibacter europaeus TaxID=33995 RepID=A0A0M0EHF7_KOMEU|nr:hypothetical protein [Komagataeibacter europaeus]ARW16199.1 hypothetical protein S101446_01063 [Komagataeibacter europaeus]KON64697.1 hypothetical protein KOEU_16620 [Komagataeibacter europaeus]
MGRPFVPWLIINGKALDRARLYTDVLRPLCGHLPAMMPEDT